MAVAADASPDVRAGYLIPAETLASVWPELYTRTLPPTPYRGLSAFREQDSSLFFGREDFTEGLLADIVRRPLVAVVGPSGSGKSSVIFAGVLPRLRQREGWVIVTMRPSQASSPLAALASALLAVLEPELSETQRLRGLADLARVLADGHLLDVVERVLARAGGRQLLLVVDQFEEVFTREPAAVRSLVDLLIPAQVNEPVANPRALTVLLTMRADFLGRALEDTALAGALTEAITAIGRMGAEQLRAAIEGPLPAGAHFEAGLVERILDDVGDEPGNLPLLQFALTLLWEHQDRELLTHRAYDQLGGADGAMARYAEEVYCEQLPVADHDAVRGLLVQLVQSREATDPIRRVARRTEIGEQRWQLAQRLAATRLVVAGRDVAGVDTVELVHEALIDGWTRLSKWVEEDKDFRGWQDRLRGAVRQWESTQRDRGALLRGAPSSKPNVGFGSGPEM